MLLVAQQLLISLSYNILIAHIRVIMLLIIITCNYTCIYRHVASYRGIVSVKIICRERLYGCVDQTFTFVIHRCIV